MLTIAEGLRELVKDIAIVIIAQHLELASGLATMFTSSKDRVSAARRPTALAVPRAASEKSTITCLATLYSHPSRASSVCSGSKRCPGQSYSSVLKLAWEKVPDCCRLRYFMVSMPVLLQVSATALSFCRPRPGDPAQPPAVGATHEPGEQHCQAERQALRNSQCFALLPYPTHAPLPCKSRPAGR